MRLQLERMDPDYRRRQDNRTFSRILASVVFLSALVAAGVANCYEPVPVMHVSPPPVPAPVELKPLGVYFDMETPAEPVVEWI